MQLYHCHSTPLKKHIHKGLYGAFIIDPPKPRKPAQELVMVMNGFDTDGDGRTTSTPSTGPAFYYARYPIRVSRSQTVRIYLANLTEFDLINSFHLHGDFFRYYRTGRDEVVEYTDTVMLGQGERGIIEIDFANTGPVHVPRAPVGVRRARLDGLLRRGRVTEIAERAVRSVAPLGAGPARRARRDRVALRHDRRLADRPARAHAAAGRRLRRSRGRVQAGRDQSPRDEPSAGRPDDRDRHGRRRDRPVQHRRADHARATALGDDRDPVRRGSTTSRC